MEAGTRSPAEEKKPLFPLPFCSDVFKYTAALEELDRHGDRKGGRKSIKAHRTLVPCAALHKGSAHIAGTASPVQSYPPPPPLVQQHHKRAGCLRWGVDRGVERVPRREEGAAVAVRSQAQHREESVVSLLPHRPSSASGSLLNGAIRGMGGWLGGPGGSARGTVMLN